MLGWHKLPSYWEILLLYKRLELNVLCKLYEKSDTLHSLIQFRCTSIFKGTSITDKGVIELSNSLQSLTSLKKISFNFTKYYKSISVDLKSKIVVLALLMNSWMLSVSAWAALHNYKKYVSTFEGPPKTNFPKTLIS